MSKNKKVRVFISQLMKDKSDEEIEAERAAVKNAILYAVGEEQEKIIESKIITDEIGGCRGTGSTPTPFERFVWSVEHNNLDRMRGSIQEYLTCFAKPEFKDNGWVEFLDSFMPDLEVPEDVNKEVYYISKSTEVLSHADLVIFTEGWKKGRGTFLEHYICQRYNIPHIELLY